MQIQLKGKVALVTGGAVGIGREIALTLARAGADVAINYFHSAREAEETLKLIQACGVRGMAVMADVTRVDDIEQMVREVASHLGEITILVNNAGGMVGRQSIAEITEPFYQRVMDLNVKSAFFVSRAVIPGIRRAGWGRIINNASLAAHNGGGPGATTYAAAKAALLAFTKGLAKELAPVATVNAVAPGLIGDTPFHQTYTSPEAYQSMKNGIPLGREGFPADVAPAVCFLASEQAGFITGETLEINGGVLMR